MKNNRNSIEYISMCQKANQPVLSMEEIDNKLYQFFESPVQMFGQFYGFVDNFIEDMGGWKNVTWDYSTKELLFCFLMYLDHQMTWDGETWNTVNEEYLF